MGARFQRIIHAQHTQYTSFYTPQHFTNTRPRTKSIMICSRSLLCAAGLILVIQGTLATLAMRFRGGHMCQKDSVVDRVVNRAHATTIERHPEDHRDYHMTPINVPELEDSDKLCVRQVLTPRQTHLDGVYMSQVTGECPKVHGDHHDQHVTDFDMLRQLASAPQMTLPEDATLSQTIDHVANEHFKEEGTEQINPERVQHLNRSCVHPCKAAAFVRTPSLSGRIQGVIRGNGHQGLIEVEKFETPLSPRSSAARINDAQKALDKCSHSHEETQAPEADDAATLEMPKAGTR